MTDLRLVMREPKGRGIIATLQDLLKQARAGEISAVAVAIVYPTGAVGRCWSEVPSPDLMVGAIEQMKLGFIYGDGDD